MARYIDVDKLCKGLKEMASVQYPDKQNTILGVISTIENTPTADVVEAVRCKDCKYYSRPYGACYRNISPFITTKNDFCSCGERRDT